MSPGISIDRRNVVISYGRDLYVCYEDQEKRYDEPKYWDPSIILSEYPLKTVDVRMDEFYSELEKVDYSLDLRIKPLNFRKND